MPKRRYERQEPSHEWSQIRPHLKDTAQIKYELIRPVILFGVSARCDFPHKLERFVKHIVASRFEQERL